MEGKTGRQCERIQKQCEDRKSGANRAVGTNRKSTLPGRPRHLTQARKVHSEGLLSGLPKTELHSVQGRGREGCGKETVKVQTGRTWQQRTEAYWKAEIGSSH